MEISKTINVVFHAELMGGETQPPSASASDVKDLVASPWHGRKERIEQAKDDWQAGRFPVVPDDAEEFIPLPDPK